MRVQSNGVLDATFGTQGSITLPTLGDPNRPSRDLQIIVAADGSSFVVRTPFRDPNAPRGYFLGNFDSDLAVTRLNANGSINTDYGQIGTTILGGDLNRSLRARGAHLLSDNRLMVSLIEQSDSGFSLSSTTIIRLTTNGQLDSSYDGDGGLMVLSTYGGDSPQTLFQNDGSAIIVFARIGTGQGYNLQAAEIVRLTPSGQRDVSFGPNGLAFVDLTKAAGNPAFFNVNSVVSLTGNRIGLQSSTPEFTPTPDGVVRMTAIDLNASGLTLPVVNDHIRQVYAEFSARTTLFGTQKIFPEENNTLTTTLITDINNDGVDDVVFSSLGGVPLNDPSIFDYANKPYVRIRDGRTGNDLLPATLVYEETFRGGVVITAADLNGDGKKELITAPGYSGSARIQVFNVVNGSLQTLSNFFAIEDPNFRGGAYLATGDFNGDGTEDVAVSAGFGGGPRIAIFNGNSLSSNLSNPPKLLGDFFAFGGADIQNIRNGVYVAAGDFNNDGKAELIFGGGPNGGPRVMVVDGATLIQNGSATALSLPLANFFVEEPEFRRGAPIRTRYLTGTGTPEFVAISDYSTDNAFGFDSITGKFVLQSRSRRFS